MPCGGIWTPFPGSHWLQHPCFVCGAPDSELFCDEWDTPLHVRCLGKFLESDEGKCMLLHGHGIQVLERTDTQGWPGVECNPDPAPAAQEEA